MSVKALFDLTGKVALVTGGSRGLGLQMAEALGEMGAKLILTARKQAELDEAAARLRGQGVEAHTLAADLGKTETIPGVADRALERWGQVDILVNNAGTSWGAPAEDHPADAWNKVLRLNLDATFFLSQAVAKRSMIPRRQGKIVNMASVAGLSGNPPNMQTVSYNASKGAVVNLTRALAAEWGRHGINVNALCPGFFHTRMTDFILSQIEKGVVAATPLGRLGGEEDLKGAVVFLASEASRHVTGHCLVVDGGVLVS
jgi:gluconate 5-dehydrogenase